MWKSLDDMENAALTMIGAKKERRHDWTFCGYLRRRTEKRRVLRKYWNTKKHLKSVYPWLADCIRGEYGPIRLNDPEVRRKIREMSRRRT
jgi:proteasome lid subunit RPN8/RPN11